MARKKRYATPEDMKKHVNEYFAEREEKGEFPSFAGMLTYLGISRSTYGNYMNTVDPDPNLTEEERHGYRKVFEDAQLRREDWLEKMMVSAPRMANGCMNSLKQPQNGGFKDKIEADVDATIRVITSGVGGDDAFK